MNPYILQDLGIELEVIHSNFLKPPAVREVRDLFSQHSQMKFTSEQYRGDSLC